MLLWNVRRLRESVQNPVPVSQKYVWKRINDSINNVVDSMTLQELLDNSSGILPSKNDQAPSNGKTFNC